MKSYISFIGSLFLISCLSNDTKVNAAFDHKPIPAFDFLLMDSVTKINTSSIPPGKPFVIFYFNPHCPYCISQTKDIVHNIKPISNIKIYFLSNYPFREIEEYMQTYKLKDYPNITVAYDYEVYFGNFYNPPGVPYTVIYDGGKKVKRTLLGKVSAKLIQDIVLK